jgi:hypothetical protein
MESLKELRIKRDRLSVRISNYTKKGKDTTELMEQLTELRSTIANYDTLCEQERKKQEAAASRKAAKMAKSKPAPVDPNHRWAKEELAECRKQVVNILDSNDWRDGYQFRSSLNMYIPAISVTTKDNAIQVRFLMQYRTTSRRVENTITKTYNPATVHGLQSYIDRMELWVMHNSGDLDDKTIVFGERFNRVRFKEEGYERKGWVIKK